jgi:hypothetical protein
MESCEMTDAEIDRIVNRAIADSPEFFPPTVRCDPDGALVPLPARPAKGEEPRAVAPLPWPCYRALIG